MANEPPIDSPPPDLSRYDATELNEAAAMVMSEIGWQPLSKRYRMAAALLDARGRRHAEHG